MGDPEPCRGRSRSLIAGPSQPACCLEASRRGSWRAWRSDRRRHRHDGPAGASTRCAERPLAPNADRVREYQDRLRAMEALARQQAAPEPTPEMPPPVAEARAACGASTPWSRRGGGRTTRAFSRATSPSAGGRSCPALLVRSGCEGDRRCRSNPPSLDEIAEAVVRASAKAGQAMPSAPAVRAGPSGR